jgi:hypothetical protein
MPLHDVYGSRALRLLRIGLKATCAAKQHCVYLALQNVMSQLTPALAKVFAVAQRRPNSNPPDWPGDCKVSGLFFGFQDPLALAGFFLDFYAIGSQDLTNFGARRPVSDSGDEIGQFVP